MRMGRFTLIAMLSQVRIFLNAVEEERAAAGLEDTVNVNLVQCTPGGADKDRVGWHFNGGGTCFANDPEAMAHIVVLCSPGITPGLQACACDPAWYSKLQMACNKNIRVPCRSLQRMGPEGSTTGTDRHKHPTQCQGVNKRKQN